MSTTRLNVALANAAFPFSRNTKGGGVLFPNADREPSFAARLSYISNLLPSNEGFSTVKALHQFLITSDITLDPVFATRPNIQDVRTVYTVSGTVATYLIITDTAWIGWDGAAWVVLRDLIGSGINTSVFTIKGVTYVYAQTDGLFTIDDDIQGVTTFPITGLTLANVVSMTSANSYMIAATVDTLHWDAPLSNGFFTPDGIGDEAGAGATKVLALNGVINLVNGITNGVNLFTSTNIITAEYTGNPNNPWAFNEVKNSSGVFNSLNTTKSNSADLVFAWSDTGIVAINSQQADYVFPELTDFLTNDHWELLDSDPSTDLRVLTVDNNLNTIDWVYLVEGQLVTEVVTYDTEFIPPLGYSESTDVGGVQSYAYPQVQFVDSYGLNKKIMINFVATRYLVISYGLENSDVYDYMLVLDIQYKKWGKITLPHLAVFDDIPPEFTGTTYQDLITAGTTYADLLASGTRFADWLAGVTASQFRASQFNVLVRDVNALSIKTITSTHFVKLSDFNPTGDRYYTTDALLLPAQLMLSDISSTRGRELSLTEVTMYFAQQEAMNAATNDSIELSAIVAIPERDDNPVAIRYDLALDVDDVQVKSGLINGHTPILDANKYQVAKNITFTNSIEAQTISLFLDKFTSFNMLELGIIVTGLRR